MCIQQAYLLDIPHANRRQQWDTNPGSPRMLNLQASTVPSYTLYSKKNWYPIYWPPSFHQNPPRLPTQPLIIICCFHLGKQYNVSVVVSIVVHRPVTQPLWLPRPHIYPRWVLPFAWVRVFLSHSTKILTYNSVLWQNLEISICSVQNSACSMGDINVKW